MNVDLLIKENKELNEECQRYKDMWLTTNNSLAKYRKLEEEIGLSVEEMATILKAIKPNVYYFPIYDEDNNERLSIWQEDIYDDVPLLQTSIEDTKLNNALKKFFKKIF